MAVVQLGQLEPGDFTKARDTLLVSFTCRFVQLLFKQRGSLALETKGEADAAANKVGVICMMGDAAAQVGHHQCAQRIKGVALEIVVQGRAVAHVLCLPELFVRVLLCRRCFIREGFCSARQGHFFGRCGQWGTGDQCRQGERQSCW